MAREAGPVRKTLIWSYERGTLQYDIICALILAFIFFVPRSCFIRHHNIAAPDSSRGAANMQSAPAGSQPAGQ